MIKLNNYWYSYEEVREALEKKGYTIVLDEHEPDKRGNIKTEWSAIKDGQTQTIQSAAIKEFHKKPPLV
ncbi:hypothetical protein CO230_08775 [Chryseobacterium sp. 6424]|uniref:hypothetical protein n=1 Tax=Chryseobacterium sp. 6424 TaxID=2039166 RepID=UPI000EFD7C52|nr:hypothetical protein [Chryseobacterium sp. 6424]AYO58208.1 hypothetical protein CO230_08775 [Chryseobacterium sp. 6424]